MKKNLFSKHTQKATRDGQKGGINIHNIVLCDEKNVKIQTII